MPNKLRRLLHSTQYKSHRNSRESVSGLHWTFGLAVGPHRVSPSLPWKMSQGILQVSAGHYQAYVRPHLGKSYGVFRTMSSLVHTKILYSI